MSLSYTFSWPPSAPSTRPVVSYTLTCCPSLAEVAKSELTTPNNSTTSASLSFLPGLSYNCCVVATSIGVAPSDKTCLDNLVTTPTAGEEAGC